MKGFYRDGRKGMKKRWKSIIAVVLAVALLAAPVMAEDGTASLLSKINSMVTILQTYYYKDVKISDLADGAIKGMFGVLDPHSSYFTAKEYEEFNSSLSGEFAGVGIYIEKKDDYIQVISPIKGTPAEKAGIQAGDIIMAIDGKAIKGYSTEQAAAMMKGQAGTKVKIGIKRDGTAGIIDLELTRALIKINTVEYEIRPDNIGYIKITQFNGSVYDNVVKAINEFKAKNVKGVLIDVRNNPGGLLDEVVNICKLLIPKGPIVSIKYKNQPTETYSATLDKAPFKIVMLVNESSASASEIMAGAIKESGTGKLVGTTTYGKGTVQSVLSMTDGSGLKVTIANYLTPTGFSLDGIGITPDIEVKNNPIPDTADLVSIDGKRAIKKNMTGLDVLGVQQRLYLLGYDIPSLKGEFNDNTLKSINKFQKDNGLKVDGSIDADDLKVLNAKFSSSASKDAQLDRAILELKTMIK
jgi:carboxyl-terminal processing protease